jgi:hypothetical protein
MAPTAKPGFALKVHFREVCELRETHWMGLIARKESDRGGAHQNRLAACSYVENRVSSAIVGKRDL